MAKHHILKTKPNEKNTVSFITIIIKPIKHIYTFLMNNIYVMRYTEFSLLLFANINNNT